jgi:pimeloyl-ACP methyl ester carboxylesterase
MTLHAAVPWLGSAGFDTSLVIVACGLCALCGFWLSNYLAAGRQVKTRHQITKSPRERILSQLSPAEQAILPYPPSVLPGSRAVDTPYGVLWVYEWGPTTGQKILLLAGATTPVISLGPLGNDLVSRGYRVMIFDYFGRGYSDYPVDIPQDTRLYNMQMLLALASSPLRNEPWASEKGFHLLGYSLGGGIVVEFARYFPHLVRSLTLVTPGGLLRRSHIGWQAKILYSRGMLPESLLRWLVGRRMRQAPADRPPSAAEPERTSPTSEREEVYNHDASGGTAFDNAIVSRHMPGVSVAKVVAWQLENHDGFVPAIMDTIRDAPIYEQKQSWASLGEQMGSFRKKHVSEEQKRVTIPGSLQFDKVLTILGATDAVINKDEFVADATEALGADGLQVVVLDGGHEIVMSRPTQIANAMEVFWRSDRSVE